MDLYDIFIIVVVALFYLPGLIGKKKHGKADVPQRVFPEIEIDDPELIDGEYDDDDETERIPEQVPDPVPEPVFAAVPEPLRTPVQESVHTGMPVDIAGPAAVLPQMDIAEKIETEERKPGLHVDSKNLIVYSALMNPKFKEF